MNDTRLMLENYVRNALVEDIFKAERAYFLACAIGEQTEVLNSREHGNFGILFGAFQRSLQTEAISAISRLYDKPHPKYPIRSIPSLLQYIEDNIASLPELKQIPNLTKAAVSIGMPDDVVSLITSDQQGFAQALVTYFRLKISAIEGSLDALKNYRDKTVAHNESISDITPPLLTEIDDLLSLAKSLVGILGWAYLDYVYQYNTEYILTSDAKRPTVALKRLVKYLERYSND